MLALILIGMGSFSAAETCGSDSLDRCPADYSDLLQTKVKVSDLESESKVVGSCDAWQSSAFCDKTKRLKGGETGDKSNCLKACKAAGSKCCAFKDGTQLRCYSGTALTSLQNKPTRFGTMVCATTTITTTSTITTTKTTTPYGLSFGGGANCKGWCKWFATAESNPPYKGCPWDDCKKCQSCFVTMTTTTTKMATTTVPSPSPPSIVPEFPSEIFKCPMTQTYDPLDEKVASDLFTSGKNDLLYDQLANEIKLQYASKTTQFEKQSYASCIVRTAGHDLMDFRYDQSGIATGGSDGCINFKDGDNAGLPGCLVSNGFPDSYAKFCDKVSLGDFLVLAAEIAMLSSAVPTVQRHLADPGTPYNLEAAFKAAFLFGRPTVAECSEHDNLMPDPEEGCYDLKRVFIDHVYLDKNKDESWKMTAALSGVHTLGGAKVENSGYQGTWTQDPWVFNNAYFLRILDQGWMPQRNVAGNPKKNQWIVADQVRTPEDDKQMMLNSDLCMIFDNSLDSVNCDNCILNVPQFAALQAGPTKNAVYNFCFDIRGKGHFLNAKEKMCCTWARPDKMMTTSKWHAKTDPKSENMAFPLPALYDNKFDDNHHCGVNFTTGSNGPFFKHCCQRMYDDPSYTGPDGILGFCDYQGNLGAPGWEWIQRFAYNENTWLAEFVKAWKVATENSIKFVHASDAATASAAHFKSSKSNCGACRTSKKSYDGSEAFDESEALKQEDTYNKSFWDERKKTWPMWTQAADGADPPANLARDDVVKRLRAYLASRGLDTTWMNGMVEDVTGNTCRR